MMKLIDDMAIFLVCLFFGDTATTLSIQREHRVSARLLAYISYPA